MNKVLVGSTLYSKGTHNVLLTIEIFLTVGSTLYSKGTHNRNGYAIVIALGWIYPLFEGYTQLAARKGANRPW